MSCTRVEACESETRILDKRGERASTYHTCIHTYIHTYIQTYIHVLALGSRLTINEADLNKKVKKKKKKREKKRQ